MMNTATQPYAGYRNFSMAPTVYNVHVPACEMEVLYILGSYGMVLWGRSDLFIYQYTCSCTTLLLGGGVGWTCGTLCDWTVRLVAEWEEC